jgi:hypothetical protein
MLLYIKMKFCQWLSLNSASAVRQDYHNKHNDFEVQINPPLDLTGLKNKDLKIALTAFHGYYSWHNIRQEYDNNTIHYSCDGGRTFREIIFPNGLYSYADLNTYIDLVFKRDCKDKKPFVITFNDTTYKVSIEVFQDTIVDLQQGEFSILLGFAKVMLREGTYFSDSPPNLSHDLDNIYVHCNLTDRSLVDGRWGDVVYVFPTVRLEPGYPFSFKETTLQFSELTKYCINSIHIYITDVFGNIIPLNNAPITVQLLIKE